MPPVREVVVTSFSIAGAVHGRRCIESLQKHWQSDLVVYLDEPMPVPEGVTVRYTGHIAGWSLMRRTLPRIRPGSEKPTNYIWNAQKFAVKPFVWLDAARRLGNGIVTWLDADTAVGSRVPEGFVDDLLGDASVAYLGRGEMHPETGFVAFRIPEAMPLLRWCVDCYTLGAFRSFDDGWTDCHVLRAGMKATGLLTGRDLTSHLSEHWTSRVDAFDLSPIGPYVEHFKGPRRKREACAV